MNHVSALILQVLDEAHQVALKSGNHLSPPPPRLAPSDAAFHKASKTALRRFRRIQRVLDAQDPRHRR